MEPLTPSSSSSQVYIPSGEVRPEASYPADVTLWRRHEEELASATDRGAKAVVVEAVLRKLGAGVGKGRVNTADALTTSLVPR